MNIRKHTPRQIKSISNKKCWKMLYLYHFFFLPLEQCIYVRYSKTFILLIVGTNPLTTPFIVYAQPLGSIQSIAIHTILASSRSSLELEVRDSTHLRQSSDCEVVSIQIYDQIIFSFLVCAVRLRSNSHTFFTTASAFKSETQISLEFFSASMSI